MWKRECHDYEKPVFTVETLYIHGGSYQEIDYDEFDAIIRLIESNPSTSYTVKGTGIFKEFCREGEVNILHIPIRDRRAPSLDAEFWKKLANFLIDISEPYNEFRVGIHCHGGHGRTGLVLCILGLIYKKLSRNPIEAVEELREIYCKKAIETREQLAYILKIGTELKLLDILSDYTKYYKLTPTMRYINATDNFIGMPIIKNTEDIFETNLWETIEETEEEDEAGVYTHDSEPKCVNCMHFEYCFASEDSYPEDFDCQSFLPSKD